MLKKTAAAILALAVLFTLCACEKKPSHEQILDEISESNSAKNEKRRAFLDSPLHAEALEYLQSVLTELAPDCEQQISLEPGSLIDGELGEFADFADSDGTRVRFFSLAQLSFSVDYWNHDLDGQALADAIARRGISGRMNGRYGDEYFALDGGEGRAVFTRMPGV